MDSVRKLLQNAFCNLINEPEPEFSFESMSDAELSEWMSMIMRGYCLGYRLDRNGKPYPVIE